MRARQIIRQSIGVLLSFAVVVANYSPQMKAVRALPETLRMRAGEVRALSIGWPFALSSGDEGMYVLASADESFGVISDRPGESKLTVSMFGLPFKSLSVAVEPEHLLIPGGQSIGAALNTDGVLVVGTSELSGTSKSPARDAGICVGDMITAVEGKEIKSAADLTETIMQRGEGPLRLTYKRGGAPRDTIVHPIADPVDGRLRLGLWVRDSTAGVGTLSFYDPNTNKYGALGHAISDVDTGITLPVREGTILKSSVVGIRKGERGTPGELQGSFLRDRIPLGDIRLNNSFGIYGNADASILNPIYPGGMLIGSQQNVHTGPATILTTLDDRGVREYSVEITRVARQGSAAQKSMTLRVVDPELLDRTGGIVQGMSGSPIIQDGRIVGAVTHVFVNDPTQGYGVFIEWMLEQAGRA